MSEQPIDAAEVKQRLAEARQVVADLCEGRQEWALRIPAQESDPDIVIGNALEAAERYVDAVAARLERLEAALRDVHEPCWTAVSELESLVLTQSDLPDVYRMNVQRAFAALRKANAVLEVPDARA